MLPTYYCKLVITLVHNFILDLEAHFNFHLVRNESVFRGLQVDIIMTESKQADTHGFMQCKISKKQLLCLPSRLSEKTHKQLKVCRLCQIDVGKKM